MFRNASSYERELREILEGEPARVRGYSRYLPATERSQFERITDRPFLVVRAAGSLGFDLVALRREFAFPLEVKASGEETFRFTAAGGRALDQLAAHRRSMARVGLMALYAYRRIGMRSEEPWRLFLASPPVTDGMLGVLGRRLPAIELTRQGNAILRWGSGMPLSEFLRVLAYLSDGGTSRGP